MKLSMMINYVGDFPASAQQVVELEKVGLDIVWVAEAYSFDSISQLGYLAAVTNKVQIGTGIVNIMIAIGIVFTTSRLRALFLK